MKQLGFFDLPDHLKRLSEAGDPLEELARVIDFEAFRPLLDEALGYSDGSKGGRPAYDPVAMFKVLILAAQNNVDTPINRVVLGFGGDERLGQRTVVAAVGLWWG